MSLYLDTIRKHSKAKVVLRAHNIEHLIWQRLYENESNPVKRWYISTLTKKLKRYELSVLNKFDAIVPITTTDAETFKSLGTTVPIHVSPTGLDISKYKPDFSAIEPGSVFHLGALDWMPNQQAVKWFLNEIWPIVFREVPAAKFYLAGRNMPQYFKELKEPGVVVVGEVEDAFKFMSSKAVMVIPLLSGSGMRIKIIEGMAMGKAILSTSIGAEGIGYVEDEHIIIADSAVDFAKKIIALFQNPDKITRLGTAARQLAEQNYDNTAIIRSLTSFYEGLIRE